MAFKRPRDDEDDSLREEHARDLDASGEEGGARANDECAAGDDPSNEEGASGDEHTPDDSDAADEEEDALDEDEFDPSEASDDSLEDAQHAHQVESEPQPPPKFDNSGEVPLSVPGFGLAYDVELAENARFATGHLFDDQIQDRLSVREIGMLQLMEALTEKPEWQRKLKDPEIVAKWRREALDNIKFMSDKAFDWCMREMAEKVQLLEEKGYVLTLETKKSRVLKNDSGAVAKFAEELKQATSPLFEREPKDWHPRSNEQVLNIIHPSLYPLVYGRTRVLPQGSVPLEDCYRFCGQGEVIPALEPKPRVIPGKYSWYQSKVNRFSDRFQWLPCEVAFKGQSGTDVEITSYINNLPPSGSKDLYRLIERAISMSIEPWGQVVMWHRRGRVPVRIYVESIETDDEYRDDPRFESDLDLYDLKPGEGDSAAYLAMLRNIWDSQQPNPLMEEYLEYPEGADGESTFDEVAEKSECLDELARLVHARGRKIVIPDAGERPTYESWRDDPERFSISLESRYRDKGLQVIVKLAGIELTPEKSSYAGGSWHLEGMKNEHIVATAIFYYDVDNVTPCRLNFRHEADLDSVTSMHHQDCHDPWKVVFGNDDFYGGEALQDLGSVSTPQGRLLVFPNTLQHAVDPFELEDKSRPGHRRFLVLWLVDPHYRILSTRNVPPQQSDGSTELALKTVAQRLPAELADKVQGDVDWLMSREEAETYRLELMDERTSDLKAYEEHAPTYSFCEH